MILGHKTAFSPLKIESVPDQNTLLRISWYARHSSLGNRRNNFLWEKFLQEKCKSSHPSEHGLYSDIEDYDVQTPHCRIAVARQASSFRTCAESKQSAEFAWGEIYLPQFSLSWTQDHQVEGSHEDLLRSRSPALTCCWSGKSPD